MASSPFPPRSSALWTLCALCVLSSLLLSPSLLRLSAEAQDPSGSGSGSGSGPGATLPRGAHPELAAHYK